MAKIITLGAGMVGQAIALDLQKQHDVTTCDINSNALAILSKQGVTTKLLDFTDKAALQHEIAPFDLVVCAVPGFLGFNTLKNIIDAGKNVVDISFFPEDSLELNALAKEKGVTALVDIGVAPGMDNIILGYYNSLMEISHFRCLVGGLPKIKSWPMAYKAPFSPIDVIEEYTRPARYVENGNLVIKPALSDAEMIDFETIGTLEAFNTDGLRSIIQTMPHIPNMIEKTLRYPGHIDFIKGLKASGFFDESLINIKSNNIKPLDFTAGVLLNQWKLEENEPEFTVMRVEVEGNMNGSSKKITYDLYDERDQISGISSMSRTTGYTCTAAANLFLDGLFSEKGVFPPELVGNTKKRFDYFINYLTNRNVVYKLTEE